MTDQEKDYFEHRLTVLETTVKQNWDAHDKMSQERWGEIRRSLDLLSRGGR